MNPWQPLLAIQALDTRLDQLDHRLRALPEREARRAVEAELAALQARIDAVEATRHELDRARQRIEDEVASVEAKRAGFEKQLYGGGSSDAKQLQALQDEVASLGRRISSLEDDELEVLEQLEPVEAELASLASQRDALDVRAAAAVAALAMAESEIEADRARTRAERDAGAAAVDAAVMAQYDTARRSLGGVAVARLEPGGVCGACHMRLSAVEVDRIKHLSPDEPVRCEDCGRFLVRDAQPGGA